MLLIVEKQTAALTELVDIAPSSKFGVTFKSANEPTRNNFAYD